MWRFLIQVLLKDTQVEAFCSEKGKPHPSATYSIYSPKNFAFLLGEPFALNLA